jgi:protein ImuA
VAHRGYPFFRPVFITGSTRRRRPPLCRPGENRPASSGLIAHDPSHAAARNRLDANANFTEHGNTLSSADMSAALHPAVPGIDHLRRIASPATDFRVMPFGIAALDARLGRGLRAGALHEATPRSPRSPMMRPQRSSRRHRRAGSDRHRRSGVMGELPHHLYAPALAQAAAAASVIYAQPRDDTRSWRWSRTRCVTARRVRSSPRRARFQWVATRRLQLVAGDADIPIFSFAARAVSARKSSTSRPQPGRAGASGPFRPSASRSRGGSSALFAGVQPPTWWRELHHDRGGQR